MSEKFIYNPGQDVGKFNKYVGKVVEIVDNHGFAVRVKAEDGVSWVTRRTYLERVPDGTHAEDWEPNQHTQDALTYAGLSLDHTPDHYAIGGIDVWKYAELKFSTEANIGFHVINAIKYTTRYEHKNGLKDLIKARDSINRAIELLEDRQPKNTEKEEESRKRWEKLIAQAASELAQVIADCGYDPEWQKPTLAIMNHVSQCDPNFKHDKSTAAGLFGFLDSNRSWYSSDSVTPNWSKPYVQIHYGLKYIIDRYKTPQNALEFLNKNGWF